jgi:FlaA1/EpsC-like NDP-sugar epimerase
MGVWRKAFDVLLRYRIVTVAFIQVALAALAHYLAYALRLDDFAPWRSEYGRTFWVGLPILLVLRFAAFTVFDLFHGMWRYVSISDLYNILRAVTVSSVLFGPVVIFGLARTRPYSVSVFVLDWALCVFLLGGVRFGIRTFREVFLPMRVGRKRVLIVGAGDAGEMLLREMKRNPHLSYHAVGFVDDDPRKRNAKIHEVRVLGRIDELGEIIEREGAEDVIVSIPSATGRQMERILEICRNVPIRLRHLPSEGDIVRLTQIRDVELEDLLDRDPIQLDVEGLREAHQGKRILVTGAGGSIGSEIVRQLAVFEPEHVCLLDWSENALFFLERELLDRYPALRFTIEIGDIKDAERMDRLFSKGRFDRIYHAAAFKHVPLMEQNPCEAVKNNLGGTRVLARCAVRHGTARFLLISTDKAVRPTSVMGASKRTAELVVASMSRESTQFVSVRFGNVLGSQGSVVPLFKRQIAAGGPVTVTDPEVVRFFMTIPEAVQLVLQAATLGRGGEVFVLDMGKPVKIDDLARKLIKLSGFRPGEDIAIRYVGLRPGEKLYEELLNEEAGVRRTEHEKIWVLEGVPSDAAVVGSAVNALLAAAERGDVAATVRGLASLVPEYRTSNPGLSDLIDAPPGGKAS